MAYQDLPIWSRELVADPVTEDVQRRDLLDEEMLHGFLRQMSVSTQQFNSLMFLITASTAPSPFCIFPWDSTKPVPNTALEMNGQVLTAVDTPELYNFYGATLPDYTGVAPTGLTYIVRKH